jgi:hypothetical protein
VEWDLGHRHSVTLADAVASCAPKPPDGRPAGEGDLVVSAAGVALSSAKSLSSAASNSSELIWCGDQHFEDLFGVERWCRHPGRVWHPAGRGTAARAGPAAAYPGRPVRVPKHPVSSWSESFLHFKFSPLTFSKVTPVRGHSSWTTVNEAQNAHERRGPRAGVRDGNNGAKPVPD